MLQKHKGSRLEGQLVSRKEAARLLNISFKALSSLIQRGIIEPIYGVGKTGHSAQHFRMQDISALAQTYSRKLDLPTCIGLAQQAIVTTRATASRVDELFEYLGLENPTLPTDETSVLALYIRARDLPDVLPENAQSIRDWARTLYAIDESYLALAREYTGSEEPWKVFLDSAHELLNAAPVGDFPGNPPLKFAYSYLTVVRNNLRIVSYHYCRQYKGPVEASRVFHEEGRSPREGVHFISLLFPHMPDM